MSGRVVHKHLKLVSIAVEMRRVMVIYGAIKVPTYVDAIAANANNFSGDVIGIWKSNVYKIMC